ncbi:MAG: FtsX-like permease family protein [bacterium]
MRPIKYIKLLRLFTFKKIFLILAISISGGITLLSFSTLESIKPFVKNLFRELNGHIFGIFIHNQQTGLSYKDIGKLKEILSIRDACGYITENTEAKYKEDIRLTNLLYIPDNFQKVVNLKVLSGRFLNKNDFFDNNKICLMGFEIYKELGSPKINSYIEIKNTKYKIIGILNKKPNYAMDGFVNNCILLPIIEKAPNYKELLVSASDFKRAKLLVSYYIMQTKKLKPGQDFGIFSIEPLIEWEKAQLKLWVIGGMGISFVILLLASIGIWVIFSIEVNIRKKEIGILRSIGAKKRDIFFQFILEGILIGLIGWNIGIILSIFFLPFLSSFYRFNIYPSFSGIIISFLIINIFTIWGIIPPAKKATSIYPQEVLRYE